MPTKLLLHWTLLWKNLIFISICHCIFWIISFSEIFSLPPRKDLSCQRNIFRRQRKWFWLIRGNPHYSVYYARSHPRPALSVLSLFLFPKLILRHNVQPVPHYIFNSRKLKRKEQDLATLPFPWLILVHQDDGCVCITEGQSSTIRERTKQWSQINTWSSFRIQGELNFLHWGWLMLSWTICAMFLFQVVNQTLVPFSYSYMHLIN